MNGTALLGRAVDIPLLITTKSATMALYNFFLYWRVNLGDFRRVYRKFLRTAVQLGGLTTDWSENSTRISSWDSLVSVYPSSVFSSLFESVRYIGFSWNICSLSMITENISMLRRLPRYEVQSYLKEEGQILWPEPNLSFGIPFRLYSGWERKTGERVDLVFDFTIGSTIVFTSRSEWIYIYIKTWSFFSIPHWNHRANRKSKTCRIQ